MKHHSWSPEKNDVLKSTRNICFEDVVFYIEAGGLLDIVNHPNQVKYAVQKVCMADIEGYAYLVPFIESEQEVFLKTIIPIRKATKQYLGANND